MPLVAALARITAEPANGSRHHGRRLARRLPRPTSASSTRRSAGRWSARALQSQGKNTPFLGLEVPGKVRYTLVGGQVVYEA